MENNVNNTSTDEKRNFDWVDNKSLLEQALKEVNDALSKEPLLAMDCEGHKLSRNGTLDILILSVRNKAYLIDVKSLGKEVFETELRSILESCTYQKLMFDCRKDADILKHQYQVHLDGVYDLQLLEILHRRQNEPKTNLPLKKNGSYWNAIVNAVERLSSYKKCIQLYTKDDGDYKVKERGRSIMLGSKTIWATRPLPASLKDYCCVDTMGLFKLYDELIQNGKRDDIMRVASARYADYYRGFSVEVDDMFHEHGFLPMRIIPEGNSLTFAYGNRECTGCKRMFPRDDFSATQVRKGTQMCPVCKKIDQRHW